MRQKLIFEDVINLGFWKASSESFVLVSSLLLLHSYYNSSIMSIPACLLISFLSKKNNTEKTCREWNIVINPVRLFRLEQILIPHKLWWLVKVLQELCSYIFLLMETRTSSTNAQDPYKARKTSETIKAHILNLL